VKPPSHYWGFDAPGALLTLRTEADLQRLYSSFARGWPGVGLLSLRLIAAVFTAHNVVAELAAQPSFRTAMECAAGLLLCAGLWTPIAGCAVFVSALWAVFSGIGEPWSQALLAAVGAAIAMLGPGAWSVDARMFGRKRII